MRRALHAGLGALAVTAVAAMAPASAQAACADLNNNGSVTTADSSILATCLSNCILSPPCDPSDCPAVSPGPLCGDGTLSCADTFGNGATNSVSELTADSAVLTLFLAGRESLYDLCEGPGPAIACPGGVATIGDGNFATLTPNLTTSQTWPAGCTVTIEGTLFVETPLGGPTTVLRIEPGVTVKGLFGSPVTNPSALIFLANNDDAANRRKAKIDAQGTQSSPIIMTSSVAPGGRGRGDWGGVMFNGLADVNGPGCKFQAEGIPTAFGGCESDDSSGIATFVRSEFSGIGFSANNELNSFTMNAVGSQTQFNFIAANDGLDDCHEWFGGNINQKNLLASACGDDALDWQLGFSGSVQYAAYIQNGSETDPGSDSRGFESDNSEFDFGASPRSNPDFCNVTLVGARNQAGQNGGSDSGVLLRRGTSGQLANMVVTSFLDNGLEMRDNATSNNACVDANDDGIPESLTGNLIVRNSIFYDNGSGAAGTATEHPLNSSSAGSTLDANGTACDAAACSPETNDGVDETTCNCDSESFYALLVSGFNVTNPCGSNAVNPTVADGDAYPPLDAVENAACTGVGTPSACCTGVGTGVCRELFDFRATPGGGAPAAFDCSQLNPLFDDNTTANYLGALNPAASCTTTGGSASCDWISKPWASHSID